MAKSEKKNQKPKKGADGGQQNEQSGDGTLTVRLSEKSGKGLSELAGLDGLKSAAEAFEKHFGPRLQHLLISLTKQRLTKLEAEAGPPPKDD